MYTKYQLFCIFLFTKTWESAHSTFLLHLDVMNMKVDCLTPSQVLFSFLCLHMCASLEFWGSGGLIDECVCEV